MPGPQPADPAVRQRRNRPTSSAVIEATPAQVRPGKVPALGRYRPDVRESVGADGGRVVERTAWHAQTRRWWSTIWRSAVAGRFIDAQVPQLIAVARLVDDFWRATTAAEAKLLHAEMRMALREFGLYPMAARALGWEFRRPIEAVTAPPKLPPGADPRKILSLPTRATG